MDECESEEDVVCRSWVPQFRIRYLETAATTRGVLSFQSLDTDYDRIQCFSIQYPPLLPGFHHAVRSLDAVSCPDTSLHTGESAETLNPKGGGWSGDRRVKEGEELDIGSRRSKPSHTHPLCWSLCTK